MMKPKQILLSSPHMSGNEQKYIDEAFETNWIAPLGPNVNHFETELARYSGTVGASVTSSGTAAIHLALTTLGVKKGDTVFCSTFTFIASANPAVYLGAEVVFIDSELDSWNMSPEALERALVAAKKVNRLPKAIIVVNLYGQSAKMNELCAIADAYGVPIVEDAAESLGAEYKGKKSGSIGKIGIYSFNGNKIITTSGGGAIVSNDEELLIKSRFLATQAKDAAPYYEHSQIGYNYRMSNILAGVGRAQLAILDERVQQRRAIFERYTAELGPLEGLHFMPELADTKSNRWLTTMLINPAVIKTNPFDVMVEMNEQGIETRALWKPLHLQPVFKHTAFYVHRPNEMPISEALFSTGICLPSGSNMTEDDQYRVIDALKKVLNKQPATVKAV